MLKKPIFLECKCKFKFRTNVLKYRNGEGIFKKNFIGTVLAY